jgi:hypothetical protein
MPVSLGQAISGKYAQNYDSTTPLLKGFQIGAQKRQNSEVARARKEAAQQKQNDNFLKQVSGSILVKGIDDLDKPIYQEQIGGTLAEVQKMYESGDADNYVSKMKILGQLPIINENFQARGKAFTDLRVARNKGEMGSEDMETWDEMVRTGDPRKLKGKVNKLFADPITKGFASSVTEDGMMVRSPYNRVNVNKYMDDYIGKMGTQNVAILQSAYPTMYQNIKGIPSDQAQLKQLAGADYAKLQGIITMEDFAANAWKNNQDLQNTYLDNNRADLLEKFGGENIPINQNPKAMEYARAKFIDEQKNRAKAEMKLEGIKQVSNGKSNNYDESYTRIAGGGGISNKVRIQPSSSENGLYVMDRIGTNGEPEILKATFFEGKDAINFDKVQGYYRVGDDKYIVKGSVDGKTKKLFGLTRQEINTSTKANEKLMAEAKIAFDADKEEALRQDYVKLRKSLGDTRDYSELFNGDNEGQPTYQNKWEGYQSKDFPKKGTPTSTKKDWSKDKRK